MTEKSTNFKDLRVWQLAVDWTDHVFAIAEKFPTEQRYILVKQLVRASLSVPSNIAEGSLRGSKKEFAHFINIARGSLAEAETQIIIAKRRNYISDQDYQKLESDILSLHKMLMKLLISLKE